MEFYTALENCDVVRPDGTPTYCSFEPRPIYTTGPHVFVEPLHIGHDTTRIIWYSSGEVVRWSPDGTKTTWYKRPTWDDVLPQNTCVQYNADGSVYQSTPNYRWFWGSINILCKPYSVDEDNAKN